RLCRNARVLPRRLPGAAARAVLHPRRSGEAGVPRRDRVDRASLKNNRALRRASNPGVSAAYYALGGSDDDAANLRRAFDRMVRERGRAGAAEAGGGRQCERGGHAAAEAAGGSEGARAADREVEQAGRGLRGQAGDDRRRAARLRRADCQMTEPLERDTTVLFAHVLGGADLIAKGGDAPAVGLLKACVDHLRKS